MKKMFFLCLLLAIAGMLAAGCSSCQSGNKEQEEKSETVYNGDYDGVAQDFTAGTKHIMALHRQEVYLAPEAQGKEIWWYETKVELNDTVTADRIDDLHIVSVSDVFQTFEPNLSYTVSDHVRYGHYFPRPVYGTWIEDMDNSNVEISLGAEDALQRLKEWNGIIPAAKSMTLRRPVGPIPCDAHWVLGDMMTAVWINAVTGEVTEWCPAFPMPEWD